MGRGPAKGDINHHFYDTFDLTPHLRPGRNALAVIVQDMSRVAHRPALLGAPCSVMTYAGGFVLEGPWSMRRGPSLSIYRRMRSGESRWIMVIVFKMITRRLKAI